MATNINGKIQLRTKTSAALQGSDFSSAEIILGDNNTDKQNLFIRNSSNTATIRYAPIDDTGVDTHRTWSSDKINSQINSVGSSGGGDPYLKYDMALLDSPFNYYNADLFDSTARIDASSVGTYDVIDQQYILNNALSELITTNLYDFSFGLSNINSAGVILFYTGSDPSEIYLSNNGGTDWVSVENNGTAQFSTTGTDLRLKVTGTGLGACNIQDYAVLYQSNYITTTLLLPKIIPFYYESVATDEDIVVNNFQFGRNIQITGITINARTAPSGQSLQIVITKNNSEQNSTLSSLNSGTTTQTTTFSNLSFLDSDNFGLKIKQIGSGTQGEGLTILIHYLEDGPQIALTNDWTSSIETRVQTLEYEKRNIPITLPSTLINNTTTYKILSLRIPTGYKLHLQSFGITLSGGGAPISNLTIELYNETTTTLLGSTNISYDEPSITDIDEGTDISFQISNNSGSNYTVTAFALAYLVAV